MSAPSRNSDDLKIQRSQLTSRAQAQRLRKYAPFSAHRHGDRWQVTIYWKNFALCALSALLLGWFGTASAAYLFVKYRRDFTEVRFTHMLLLPIRWQDYQKSQGEFLIKKGKDQLKQQNYSDAFTNLRLGLIKSPANKEGRLILSQFYGAWKRPDLCRTTLLDGFKYLKDDPDYLRNLFAFLLQQQDDQQVLKFSKVLLDNDPTITPRNQLVALASASASYFRGNYDQAEAVTTRYQVDATRDGRLLLARINWDRGARELALEQIRALASQLPNDEEIYAATITYLREAGRHDEARRESFVRALANPQNARARIDMLHAYQKEGDTPALRTNIEDIFRDLGGDPNALLALADFAANTGDPQLALRVYEHARSHNQNWEGAALMTVESYVVAKQYQAALELVRDLLKENPEWGKRYYAVFNGLQAVAHYGLGDAEASQLFLNNFLNQDNVRAENLIAVSRRLLSVGSKAQARQVLDHAVQADALNQAALTNLIQLDLELNNAPLLAPNVRKLLAMRKPSLPVLRAAYALLGSDLFLFSPDRAELLQRLQRALAGPLN